jgi:hypothetical protein
MFGSRAELELLAISLVLLLLAFRRNLPVQNIVGAALLLGCAGVGTGLIADNRQWPQLIGGTSESSALRLALNGVFWVVVILASRGTALRLWHSAKGHELFGYAVLGTTLVCSGTLFVFAQARSGAAMPTMLVTAVTMALSVVAAMPLLLSKRDTVTRPSIVPTSIWIGWAIILGVELVASFRP